MLVYSVQGEFILEYSVFHFYSDVVSPIRVIPCDSSERVNHLLKQQPNCFVLFFLINVSTGKMDVHFAVFQHFFIIEWK